MNIRIAGMVNDSIVDGPGIRLCLFTQGCFHNCLGCHNPQTHDPNGGYDIDTGEIIEKMKKNPLLDGITFSGGEPFLQPIPLIELARATKEMGLNVISYTGYLWEDIIKNEELFALAKEVDFIIDGPFVKEKMSLMLNFRGSSNQRIIDVKKSLSENTLVLVDW